MQAAQRSDLKPKLLFVDDEQRVLNSMRIMFRRHFDLYLASRGREALEIIKGEDIDVIVADHRMPQMTGVELLARVRVLSPRTVRILLTGYADLDAVEGSINEGEVFRFLTKPCPPQRLRETIQLATQIARASGAGAAQQGATARCVEDDGHASARSPASAANSQPASDVSMPISTAAALAQSPEHHRSAPHSLGDTAVLERPAFRAADATPARARIEATVATGPGIVVFTADKDVLRVIWEAVRGSLPVYHASNIAHVVKILTDHRPGVLVTDVSAERDAIQAMTARLKEHLPELVTITVSEHRDVRDMVWLINHGQVFRFLRKPLSPGRCAISLQAALKHHRMLLQNPHLVKRHEVRRSTAEHSGALDNIVERLKTVRRLWAAATR